MKSPGLWLPLRKILPEPHAGLSARNAKNNFDMDSNIKKENCLKEANYTIIDVFQGKSEDVFEHLIKVDLAQILKRHGIFPGVYVHAGSYERFRSGSENVLYFDDYSMIGHDLLFYIPNISFVLRFFNLKGTGRYFFKEIRCYVHVKQLYVDAVQVTFDFTFVTSGDFQGFFFHLFIKHPLISYINTGMDNLKMKLRGSL
ncbi:hypothetical protein [Flavobacterium sp. LPB0248]|uniref:hypothetical protein n=1 Tax=Flavobacterium sp. LPB0248 TaxID=2614441 RepID=UPI001C495139|nr:hypothetical protein [Flavobacterium sp. LPB0248]